MTGELALARNERGQLLPGQRSLNPDGKPKQKIWREAILDALNTNPSGEPRNAQKLQAISEALIVAAKAGDLQAIKEIGDRIDGKVPQTLGQSDEDAPLFPPSVSLIVVDAAAGIADQDTESLLTDQRPEEV